MAMTEMSNKVGTVLTSWLCRQIMDQTGPKSKNWNHFITITTLQSLQNLKSEVRTKKVSLYTQ